MNWLEKELSGCGLNCSEEAENRILSRLFELWSSEEGRAKRALLEARDAKYATERAICEYEESVFLFIRDDAARNSPEVADEKLFSPWLSDASSASKIAHLKQTYPDQAPQIDAFLEDLRTLQGAKASNLRSYRYSKSKNPRASILWDCALCVASRAHLYGSGDATIQSVISEFTQEVSSNIGRSGYTGVDLENVLDAYIAFSIYQGIAGISR